MALTLIRKAKNLSIQGLACPQFTSRYLSGGQSNSNKFAPKRQPSHNQEPQKDPLEHDDFFGVRNLVTMKDLFDSRVYMGHVSGTRNPYMRPFIFGNRLNMDIIDLEKTLPLLQDALNFAAHIAYREGIILFISRHPQTLPLVERVASQCGEYAHCRKWQLGTFTNSVDLFGAITRLPDLCIFLSTHDSVFEQHKAVVESAKCNIPTIGILDTSCDPRLITYPVPGNDDSPNAIHLYCELFKRAIMKGKQKRLGYKGKNTQT